ncbi:MAG: hypothetical protein ABIO65_13360 [Nitrospiria bacterium]
MDKAVADLRDDLIEELKLITKYEAQIPVIANEDFSGVDDVVHVLGHIRDEHKHAVSTLIEFINRLDEGQRAATGHEHDEQGEHDEKHDHGSEPAHHH